LTSAGSSDVALVKLDPTLTVLWAKRIGNVSEDDAYALTRDSANNLLLLGSFSEDTIFGTNRITPNIGGQLFVTRFNVTGDFSCGFPAGHIATVAGSRGFVGDTSGNVFLANGSALLKFDSNGNMVWSRGFSQSFGIKNLTGVAVTSGTNVFVSGAIPLGTA